MTSLHVDHTLAVSWLFLLVSLWGAWFTYNAYRPMAATRWLSMMSFFAGWLTTELALHHIVWQALFTAGFVWLGALDAWPGRIGLAITLASWAGLAGCLGSARTAAAAVERGLREGLGDDYRDRIRPDRLAALSPTVDWAHILFPFHFRRPEVERVRDIRYRRVGGLDLKLDVYRGARGVTGCPVLLQVHGGAWILGSKNEQGLPLMYLLAARGWVCVSADYRLSPHATFPDPLTDLKHAIAWIRRHIAEYGGDPELLVVTGGSAGGHLATLVALTANDPAYQAGIEDVDTSVRACVSFYGVYDFTDRHGLWHHDGLRKLLERQVMKASLDEAPEAYERASPVSRIHPDAPPFLVVHGTRDTVVPVEEARRFCRTFRAVAHAPIVYADIPGAQHAFEIFPSLRAALVLHGVERFLSWVVTQSRAPAATESPRAVGLGRNRRP